MGSVNNEQVTTLVFFKYKGGINKMWAFCMMLFAHYYLKNVKGQAFYKLLGTGKYGFSPKPDWSTYGLLQIWESQDKADAFFSNSRLMENYRIKASEHWGVFLRNIISRGAWSGANPFTKSNQLDHQNSKIAVITRATIKTKMLSRFWKFVPHSQQSIWSNKGLLMTMGIGEVPFKQMATFSLWSNKEALDLYAYQTNNHVDAIKKTRELKWYKEELFSRFQPYRSFGSWNGQDPLGTYYRNPNK